MRPATLLLAATLLAGCAAPAAVGPPDACRLRLLVGFHEWPGLRAGDAYEGERILQADEDLRYVVVQPERWRDFLAQAEEDPNVRYVEEDMPTSIPEAPAPPSPCPGSGFAPYRPGA